MEKIKFFLALLGFVPATVCACPLIGGLVDYNCDGKHKVVAIGDSVVKGTGDLDNRNSGGYVLRLQKRYKKSEFINLGKAGYSSERIFSEIKSKLAKRNKNRTKDSLKDADLVIIDAGRNDFFEELPAGMTVNTLERLVDVVKSGYDAEKGEVAPQVVVATLLPTTRGFQRAFIDEVNTLLLQFTSDILPVGLLFNLFDESIISADGIHPASPGYKIIAAYVKKALVGSIKQKALADRADGDKDGIYDIFERTKFLTDPDSADTDGDTLKDGEEVFNLGTDPLVAD